MANKSITDKKDTYLVAAEMAVESNYNMIDGIINNVPKPSMLARLEEFEQRKKERHKDDFLDRKQERHREARHNRDNR